MRSVLSIRPGLIIIIDDSNTSTMIDSDTIGEGVLNIPPLLLGIHAFMLSFGEAFMLSVLGVLAIAYRGY